MTTLRRKLHLALAGAALVVWACAEVPVDGSVDDGTSDGESATTGETSGPDPSSPTNPSAESGDTGDDPSGNETSGASVTAEQVLASLADNVFAPTHAEFSVAADALVVAASSHADAVANGGDSAAARDALEAAYRDAMLVWQRVELLQLGAAAGSAGIGGEFLRDEVYSWPAVNTCRIDQEIVAGEYGQPDFIESRLVNVYGFDALEYLVFGESEDNTCPPQLPINGEGQWTALGSAELATRRAAYAETVASGIASVADTLEATWAEGGTWHGRLTDPNSGPLESTAAAMDEVLRIMFYVDKTLKDVKVARPAGIKDCVSNVCLDEVESPYAGLSKELAVANLRGFEQLFWAGPSAAEGVGFDDLLAAVGEAGLGDEMLADAEAAIAALEAIDGTFVEALTADEAALDAAHAAIVELTDDLKGDFPTVLMLNIPAEAAGDAD